MELMLYAYRLSMKEPENHQRMVGQAVRGDCKFTDSDRISLPYC